MVAIFDILSQPRWCAELSPSSTSVWWKKERESTKGNGAYVISRTRLQCSSVGVTMFDIT